MHRLLWFTTRIVPVFLVGSVAYTAFYAENVTNVEKARLHVLRGADLSLKGDGSDNDQGDTLGPADAKFRDSQAKQKRRS